ncbi:3'-5' exonuclease [Variovorax sp. YR752]|uniref:3'-5' exonuclease n=1 Tax=Variovorax sp. YR752 TaxID=1884383 RepID=UPI003137CE06
MRPWWRRTVAADDSRWVMLDVESSGLDPKRDRLLAIAAIALKRDGGAPRLALGDSFEVVIRQPDAPVDKANILVHGIGVGAQRGGVEPAQALTAFERWVGRSPLLGFHVAFDEALIQRAMRAVLGHELANPWIDLADVARVVRPDVAGRSLDEWMEVLDVRCAVRHQAAADTLATAEVLLKLWPQVLAQRQGDDWQALSRLAAQRRWLPR